MAKNNFDGIYPEMMGCYYNEEDDFYEVDNDGYMNLYSFKLIHGNSGDFDINITSDDYDTYFSNLSMEDKIAVSAGYINEYLNERKGIDLLNNYTSFTIDGEKIEKTDLIKGIDEFNNTKQNSLDCLEAGRQYTVDTYLSDSMFDYNNLEVTRNKIYYNSPSLQEDAKHIELCSFEKINKTNGDIEIDINVSEDFKRQNIEKQINIIAGILTHKDKEILDNCTSFKIDGIKLNESQLEDAKEYTIEAIQWKGHYNWADVREQEEEKLFGKSNDTLSFDNY